MVKPFASVKEEWPELRGRNHRFASQSYESYFQSQIVLQGLKPVSSTPIHNPGTFIDLADIFSARFDEVAFT